MKRALAVLLGTLVLGIIGSTAPASAVSSDDPPAPGTSTSTATSANELAMPAAEAASVASSWCGNFWRGPMWCVNFNRSWQGYLSTVTLAVAAAAICGPSFGFGCVVAVAIAAALQRYVDKHGTCPSSKPVLEVEYAPQPGGYVGCSNG